MMSPTMNADSKSPGRELPPRVDLRVARDDFRDARLLQSDDVPPLGPDAVRLKVEHWAVTANTVTYALAGERLGYWSLFPAPGGDGRVPAWGFAEVVESRHPEVAVGRRVYGFVPMSTHFTIEAALSHGGLSDASPHRAKLPKLYSTYRFVERRPLEEEGLEALLSATFGTAFLLDDLVAHTDEFRDAQVVLTSASSKTAWATAHQLAARGVHVVGLTSSQNLEFVRSLPDYSEVLEYAHAAEIPERRSVVIDFAGRRDLRAAIAQRLGEARLHTATVGATDWARSDGVAAGGDEERTAFFFAPEYAPRVAARVGPRELGAQIDEARGSFANAIAPFFRVEPRRGEDEVRRVWLDAVEGRLTPDRGVLAGW